MSDKPRLSTEELKIYEIIKRETMTSGGIKQTSVRRHPELKDLDPKKVTQIVRKLIDMDIVERVLVNSGSKRFYLLVAKDVKQNSDAQEKSDYGVYDTQNLDRACTLLLDIPCIKCRYLPVCGISHTHDPLRCSSIAYFILEKSGVIQKTRQL